MRGPGTDGRGPRSAASLATFATATEKRDYATLCDKVFAPKLLTGLQEIGLPCEVAMRNSLGKVDSRG